jgi:hypothetical protein
MYIVSRYTDSYDWSPSCTFDKKDTPYIREYKERTLVLGNEITDWRNRPTKVPIITLRIGFLEIRFMARTTVYGRLDFFRNAFKAQTEITDFHEFGKENPMTVSSKEHTEAHGELEISPMMRKFLDSKFCLIEIEALPCREGAPVELQRVNTIFENFSLANSGFPDFGIDVIQIAAEIDGYISAQSRDAKEFEDKVKIQAKGFDLKQSFRKRKN